MPNPARAERRKELLGDPVLTGDDPADVRAILERFATRAFRGVTPKPSFLDKLVAIQQVRRKADDDLFASLVEPMAVVLASPRFLYLYEPLVKRDGEPTQLSDLELASRLSYFLWAGPPDELLLAARAGKLRNPEELAVRVDRMAADPRSLVFAAGFTHQWLDLDRLDFFPFDLRNFPKFDETTRASARQEVYRTFHLLLAENLDARKLLKSDFVVIDSILADYYGIAKDEKRGGWSPGGSSARSPCPRTARAAAFWAWRASWRWGATAPPPAPSSEARGCCASSLRGCVVSTRSG